MIGQIIYAGIALVIVGWSYPKMIVEIQKTKVDLSQVPDYLADAASRKMRISLWFNGLCQLLGEALIWPVTIAFGVWLRIGVEIGVIGGQTAPEVIWDTETQRVLDAIPDPDEQEIQQRRVLQALAPVLENDLTGVHPSMVAIQLIGVARYKIKMLFAQYGTTDPDAQSGKSLRAMANLVAKAPTDDGALKDYLAAAARAMS